MRKPRRQARARLMRHRHGKGPGIAGIAHKIQMSVWLGLGLVGAFRTQGFNRAGFQRALFNYTGFDLIKGRWDVNAAKISAAYVGTALGIDLVDRKVGAWRMVGSKKILAIVGMLSPYISAWFQGGNTNARISHIGRNAIGYDAISHQTWIDTPSIRPQFQNAVTMKYGLILVSKYVGPMVNKYLPKGINL